MLHRCYLKLGQWKENLQGISEHSIPAVLEYYAAATDHDPNWYKAWHAWAYMNFETVLFYKHQQQMQIGDIFKATLVRHHSLLSTVALLRMDINFHTLEGQTNPDRIKLLIAISKTCVYCSGRSWKIEIVCGT